MGRAAKWLSILSNIPPWPGIRLEESFAPDTLLNKLAEASPTIAKIEVIRIKINTEKKDISLKRKIETLRKSDVALTPPKKPSNVFFGLTFWRNFLLPKDFPMK